LVYSVDILMASYTKFTNSIFHATWIPIKLNTKSCSTTSSKHTIYKLEEITHFFLDRNQQIWWICLCVSGVENLSKSSTLLNVFFRISKKVFALMLLLNVCYIM
jgi:hypothetical protein